MQGVCWGKQVSCLFGKTALSVCPHLQRLPGCRILFNLPNIGMEREEGGGQDARATVDRAFGELSGAASCPEFIEPTQVLIEQYWA